MALRRAALRTRTYPAFKGAKDALWLLRHRQRGTFSQFGEDREILARLGPTGLYADVGANHAFKTNNTYLLYRSGWRGLTIEPIRSHCVQHRSVRPGDVCVNAAAGSTEATAEFHELSPSGFSTFDRAAADELVDQRRAVRVGRYEVPIVPLGCAWRNAFGDQRPDLISIDTEGHELEVLAGADLDTLEPRMVVVELRSALGDEHRSELMELLAGHGYRLTAEIGVNGLFERIS